MKLSLEKTTCCLSYTVNTMPADGLVTLGARGSVGMVSLLKLEYSISSIRRVDVLQCQKYGEKFNVQQNMQKLSLPSLSRIIEFIFMVGPNTAPNI